MASRYFLDCPSPVVASVFAANPGPDPWVGGEIRRTSFAPVIVRNGASGAKFLRPMHWGFPAPGQSTELTPGSEIQWIAHVRNLASPFWIGSLRNPALRCVVPLSHFVISQGGRSLRCTPCGDDLFAVAGIWRDLTDMPVFAMLMTDPSAALLPVEGGTAPKNMPSLLPLGSVDLWFRADWKEAQQLIQPCASHRMRVEEAIS